MRLARNMEFIDLLHSRLIDEEYTRNPFYGARRMVVFLRAVGYTVNRKRVQRLMRLWLGVRPCSLKFRRPAQAPVVCRSGIRPC